MATDGMPPIAQLKGRPLGRVLIKMGKVTRAQVSEALELQKKKRGPLGQLMIELGYVQEKDVHYALAAQAGMESITLNQIDIDKAIIELIPSQMANTYRLVPTDYDKASNTIWVALASPDNFQATDDLKTLMGFNVVARITTLFRSHAGGLCGVQPSVGIKVRGVEPACKLCVFVAGEAQSRDWEAKLQK